MRTCRARWALLCTALCTGVLASADVSGTIDIEVNRDSSIRGTLESFRERHVYRLPTPAGVAGKLALRGRADIRVEIGRSSSAATETVSFKRGRAKVKFRGMDVDDEIVLQLEYTDEFAIFTPDYSVELRAKLPRKVTARRAPVKGVATFEFPGMSGMTASVVVSVPGAAAGSVTSVAIHGPGGLGGLGGPGGTGGTSIDVTPAATELAGRRFAVDDVPLAATGTYRLAIATANPGRVRAVIKLARTDERLEIDVRRVPGTAKSRVVGRTVGTPGTSIVTPALPRGQKVSGDYSGLSLQVSSGASVGAPTSGAIQSGTPIQPATGTSAGTPVGLGEGLQDVAGDQQIAIPIDMGAFPDGVGTLRVVERTPDGVMRDVPGVTCDVSAGTAIFPISGTGRAAVRKRKSARRLISLDRSVLTTYQAFGPTRRIESLARGNFFDNVFTCRPVIAPGGDVFANAAGIGIVARIDGGTGVSSIYAGGGSARADGTDRSAFDFAPGGGDITAMAIGPGGDIFVAEQATHDDEFVPLPVPSGVLYRVGSDGRVVRIAGDFSRVTVDGAAPLATGLETIVGLTVDSDGNPVLATSPDKPLDAERGERGGAVWSLDLATDSIDRLAGLGTRSPASGAAPRDIDLIGPFAFLGEQPLQLDADGRVYLVIDSGDALVRFDLERDVTEVVIEPFVERDHGDFAPPDVNLSEGAPIASVDWGFVNAISIDPEAPDQLYVVDGYYELVWRLDIARDRAFLIAGDSSRTRPLVLGGSPRVTLVDADTTFLGGISARGGDVVFGRVLLTDDINDLEEELLTVR